MSKQIDFLKRCIALNLQSGGLLDLLDRIEELERERDTAWAQAHRLALELECLIDGYVVMRRPGCMPFLETVRDVGRKWLTADPVTPNA